MCSLSSQIHIYSHVNATNVKLSNLESISWKGVNKYSKFRKSNFSFCCEYNRFRGQVWIIHHLSTSETISESYDYAQPEILK